MGNNSSFQHDEEAINAYLKKAEQAFMQYFNSPEQISPEPRSDGVAPIRYNVKWPVLSDFQLISSLGVGSFGTVYRAVHHGSKRHVALKILEKEKMIRVKQQEHVLHEKRILAAISKIDSFPFIGRLLAWWKDTANLYMAMELIKGGEMFTHLRHHRTYTEIEAKFYSAQIVLIFEFLHHLKIVYRDLKPENILFDHRTGYIKLVDFGFAKIVKDYTWTLCGTPDYLAPEVIHSRRYNKAVDWWALGVLIYEMCAGIPPFYADTTIGVYEKIIKGVERFPPSFSSELRDLLQGLLQVDVTRRLGNMKYGTKDVKNRSWFRCVNWVKLFQQKIVAPYIPEYHGIYRMQPNSSQPKIERITFEEHEKDLSIVDDHSIKITHSNSNLFSADFEAF
ncbi:hypothetical protein SNEBB_001830 [Seison nebaliae]|nr:hypothetical protein SNEBB_001830 [Seison nebaliae]